MPGDWLPARLVFYFLTLEPRDYVTYYQARGLAMGVWPGTPRSSVLGYRQLCGELPGWSDIAGYARDSSVLDHRQ